MNLAQQHAQRILDEQGYFLLRSNGPHKVGEVINKFTFDRFDDTGTECLAVIVAESTKDEWLTQRSRFYDGPPFMESGRELFYYRVMAE